MRTVFLLLFLLISSCSLSKKSVYEARKWNTWKDGHSKKYINNKNSFLNAVDVRNLSNNEVAYIIKDKKYKIVMDSDEKSDLSIKLKWPKAVLKVPNKPDVTFNSSMKNEDLIYDYTKEIFFSLYFKKSSKELVIYVKDQKRSKEFKGFKFFPYNKKSVFKGIFERIEPINIGYKTTRNQKRKVHILGYVNIKIQDKLYKLKAYSWQKLNSKKTYLALIFVDKTAGSLTYGGGRELLIKIDGLPENGANLMVDFNYATNFYCVFNPYWNCPIGLQQKINSDLSAGEMLPNSYN